MLTPSQPPAARVTILMPCLNEADTITHCVGVARNALLAAGVEGEVLVADNGSEDDSVALAEAAGARVVAVPTRGYGAALRAGIDAARGQYTLMLDADGRYDPLALLAMLPHLEAGVALVQGCRLPRGGGTVMDGAMPFLHRWLGNPVLTQLTRWLAGVPVHDVNCGVRAFRTAAIRRLPLRETGMPFAIEMLIRAHQAGLEIREVPVVLAPDLRESHAPHLSTWRDGWRSLMTIVSLSSSPIRSGR